MGAVFKIVALYTHGLTCDNAQAHPGTPMHTPRHARQSQARPGSTRRPHAHAQAQAQALAQAAPGKPQAAHADTQAAQVHPCTPRHTPRLLAK